MNIEKIDIIDNIVIRYDDMITIEVRPLEDMLPSFWNEFHTDEELLTINITNPFKRIVKFYGIINSIPTSIEELEYIDMTLEQKSILDEFIASLETAL